MNKLKQDTYVFFDSLIEKPEGSKEKVVTFYIRATKYLIESEVDFATVYQLSPQYKELRPVFEFINRQFTNYIRSCSAENPFISAIACRLYERDMIDEEFCSLSFIFEDEGDMIDVEHTLEKELKSLEMYMLKLETFFSNYLTEGLRNYVLYKDDELSIESYEMVCGIDYTNDPLGFLDIKETFVYGPSNLKEEIKLSHGMELLDIYKFFNLLSYSIIGDSEHNKVIVVKARTNFLLIENIEVNNYDMNQLTDYISNKELRYFNLC